MALILLVQVPIMLGLALVFALVLDSGRAHGSRALRLLIFLPYAVPGVVATLMWGYLYGRDFGPIGQAFRAVGLEAPNFFSEQNMLGAIMNVVTWSFVGYNMVIMYSALRVIPHELYEAAEIDGASQLRIAWSIKIPVIRPAILLTLIFSIIGSFQIFNEPQLFDDLAPTVIDDGLHAELLRLQRRLREPRRRLRGRHRVPARDRDRSGGVRRAIQLAASRESR